MLGSCGENAKGQPMETDSSGPRCWNLVANDFEAIINTFNQFNDAQRIKGEMVLMNNGEFQHKK